MYTLTWFKDAAERAVSTAAQMTLSAIGADYFDVVHLDWRAIGSIAAGAAFVSVLKSLAVGAAPIGTPGTATPVNIGGAPR